MRRKEREITDISDMERIICHSTVCRLGLSDGQKPYVVPLCFGYKDRVIYFHGSLKGKKMEILKRHRDVCVEFDGNAAVVTADEACQFGMTYQSVIGFGKAGIIEDMDEKRAALKLIMQQYADGSFQFDNTVLKSTAVIKIEIDQMTGKQCGMGNGQ